MQFLGLRIFAFRSLTSGENRSLNLESVSVYPANGNPRTGLLRTFWERDRVLRSLFRGLCVQGALCSPTRRAFLCTRKPLNGPAKNLLKSTQGS